MNISQLTENMTVYVKLTLYKIYIYKIYIYIKNIPIEIWAKITYYFHRASLTQKI